MAALNSALFTAQASGAAAIQSGALSKGASVTVRATVAVPASGAGTALNDTLGMFYLPKGATPQKMVLEAEQLDSNAAPSVTIDVGSVAASQAYIAAWAGAGNVTTSAAVGPAKVVPLPQKMGIQLTVDTPIIATIHAAAATKAAGNLSLVCDYTMDGLSS